MHRPSVLYSHFWLLLTSMASASVLAVQPAAEAQNVASQKPAPYLRTPTERQLSWHRLEYYAFAHFGPNTFTGEEWGKSQRPPDVFAPTSLDTDQWAETFKRAGMAGMILTAKHHDGMALWNTSSTTYKIANGKWAKDREAERLDADVVRMAATSAKKHGLKFGVYLSPWDIHRDPAMPKPALAGTIFDEAQIFGDGSPGDYNELYVQQLTELVDMKLEDGSNVELFEVWLDGASGSATVQTFDWSRYRGVIRTHQPGAVMWGHQGPDARWVGNEDGYSVQTNWQTISRTQDQERYGERELETGVRDGLYWTPAEADARMRAGWFWHAEEKPKTAKDLMDMYMGSVGRSVNLLLNVGPDNTGRIPQVDVDALMEFKELRDGFFERKLLRPGLGVSASSVRAGDAMQFGPENVLDDRQDTYWTMEDDQTTGSLEVDVGGTITIEAVAIQEHIALGQRVGGYAFDVFSDDAWKEVVSGTSVGYGRIDRLNTTMTGTRLRLRVTQANAVPLIQGIQAFGTRVS
ncbi:hypothetical protein MCOR29_011491 [Pyricularia oryzae]|nr:hypothetical protein MCOR01_006261 [Pyricularia oryzae]KAI6258895.1 hypothetical protein MCOR19_004738 [Pyricularia oryzae]KAI6294490.1 hypothetical protein MCOR29_011491 [Pyricularia oryzae]KAI6322499.1 hypothetical protein MCOR30_007613 [Pyricularia oryzae]KAI6360247.1 hypothetical protein MCOR32_009077 [Pyricularia oryzae]